MLLNLGKKKWQETLHRLQHAVETTAAVSWIDPCQDGLKLTDFDSHEGDNEKTVP